MTGSGYPVVAEGGHINGWEGLPNGPRKWLGVDTQ